MRKMLTCVLAAVLGVGMLSACIPSPNQDAIEAAAAYSEALTEWTHELSTAAESAHTAVAADWVAAGEGELAFEEVGIGDVLATAPELAAFDSGAVSNTPTYLAAARVAEQITAITAELGGLEPESIERLRQADYDTYWVTADLYYNTLGGPATDRLAAHTAAIDYIDDLPTFRSMVRDAGLTFAEERRELLNLAIEQMGSTAHGEDRPVVPDSTFGASIGGFAIHWLGEEVAFWDDAIEQMGSWKTVAAPYDEFWGYGNLNGVFTTPAEYAADLRPALVAQAGELAAALTELVDEPSATPKLPALGDPYRQVLLGGYLPWGDPAASQDRTASRLWMLWRIQELDKVPDAAYLAARTALLEEFNRSVAEDESIDFRPGVDRLLTFIEEQTYWLSSDLDVEGYDEMLAALKEVQTFGEALGRYPMTAEVSADFAAVLELSTQLIADIEAVMERGTTAYSAISGLVDEYLEEVEDAASPALTALDDDAQAEQLLATAIEGTAPGAKTASPSPSP